MLSSHACIAHLATHIPPVGSDLQLIDTAIKILSDLDLPTVVQSGRHMYKPEQ
jgi:hypothetical protein